MADTVELPVTEVVAAARELALAGRWQRAADLLDAATAGRLQARASLAVAAAEVAVESDWARGAETAADRLAAAERQITTTDVDVGRRWDLAFARMRHTYAGLLVVDGRFSFGPRGKDPDAVAALERQLEELTAAAPDPVRRGWAAMYRGLVLDNVRAERGAAPAWYEQALAAGERGDDLLAREALRHLGDHDHDHGDHERAAKRWARAAELGAGAGAVVGTLSQQLLLAVLARDAGDEPAAAALAEQVATWASALGATPLATQATAFLAGTDPTAAPED